MYPINLQSMARLVLWAARKECRQHVRLAGMTLICRLFGAVAKVIHWVDLGSQMMLAMGLRDMCAMIPGAVHCSGLLSLL